MDQEERVCQEASVGLMVAADQEGRAYQEVSVDLMDVVALVASAY